MARVDPPRIRFEQTNDRQINALQTAANAWFSAIARCPFLFGVSLSDTWTAGETKTLGHGLGKTPRGFIVIGADNTISMYQTAGDDKTISLHSDDAGNYTVWVF